MSPKYRTSGFAHIGLVVFVLLLVVLVAALAFNRVKKHKTAVSLSHMPLSRQIILVAEDQVRASAPPPAEAARQYAYVASAYQDGLEAGGQATALVAATQMLNMLYPASVDKIAARMEPLALEYHLNILESHGDSAIVAKYQERDKNDKHDLLWDGVVPSGPGKWVKQKSANPFTPRAGDWQRWTVTQPISVMPPPVFGSAEDNRQISIVKQAVATRNGDDINKINFWGGTPGSESPSGIWQNQLYNTVKDDLPTDQLKADKIYASIQSSIAQTMSDAFMECWKVKYTYWTARPSMRIAGIKTAMDNPNFPGYISGHSTISKAAADVLSVMVPKYQSQWQEMAVEARDSRLKAGIHFEIDNTAGFEIGRQVGAQTISAKSLTKIL